MNTDKFIQEIQDYYRVKYNDTQVKYIRAFLVKHEPHLQLLIVETLKSFDPTSTKPSPGIHDFEAALKIVKVDRLRPELQAPETLQITDGEFLPLDEGREMYREILLPLCNKANINKTEKKDENNETFS